MPGWIIALLTFPGVVLHEWAHKAFCDYFRIPVFEIRYFRVGQAEAGYVKHGEPRSFMQTFWISTGPLIINSLAAVVLAAVTIKAEENIVLQVAIGWLSVSAGMHAFPSDHDADHILIAARVSRAHGGSLLYLLAYPFVRLIAIANAFRVFWFDAAYAVMLFGLGLQVAKLAPL